MAVEMLLWGAGCDGFGVGAATALAMAVVIALVIAATNAATSRGTRHGKGLAVKIPSESS